jgi:hypothetical protein
MQITAGRCQNPFSDPSRRDRFINESLREEVGIQNLLREKITAVWPYKENGCNKEIKKGIRIKI